MNRANSIICATDLPIVRGRYIETVDLSTLTWFRVGGPADIVFMPEDEEDLGAFLQSVPADIPVYPMGVGSNLLVRDGGMRGVVVRLGGAFGQVEIDGLTIRAGASALDAQVANKAARAGVGGLEFYSGVPGTIGGALCMNAGAYGRETKDCLVTAGGFDRNGQFHEFTNEEMQFSYRHCGVAEGMFFTYGTYIGYNDDPDIIMERMKEIKNKREASQPIRERTGGSTFANPPGHKSWQLIDDIGGRGRIIGDAQMSEQHCNFMINRGKASAQDLELLGESVRADVLKKHEVELRWEIRRVGEHLGGTQ